MKWILMQLGWTAYQAECLAPWLWFFFAAGVLAGFVGLAGAIQDKEGGNVSDETP